MQQINFIREQRRAIQAFEESDRKIARKVTYGLVGFFIVFLVVLGISFFVDSRISQVNASIASEQLRLSELVPFEKDYAVFVKKVKILRALSVARKEKVDATAFFYKVLPTDYVLKDVNVDDALRQITFGVTAKDVFEATNILKFLYNKDLDVKKYSVKVTGMSRKSNGEYDITGVFSYGN